MENRIKSLFKSTFGHEPERVEEIPACGSYRRYFRLYDGSRTIIGTWNADKKENAAFVSFARSFHRLGLPVPEIYAVDEGTDVYLQEDLGGESLHSLMEREWMSRLPELTLPLAETPTTLPSFPDRLKDLYTEVLRQLARLQVAGKDAIDYSLCTPCPAFHHDAIHWDLNYFKYFFLRLLRVPFDEQALEDDFRAFSAFLLEEDCRYFLYRDFQSANIMLRDGKPCFIDFQGGRRGALQYDAASLLYDAKTRLPNSVQSELTETYIREISSLVSLDEASFRSHFQAYTLCRLMQALGAFGFRGVVEHKPGFTESIPPALLMIRDLLADWRIPVPLPALKAALEASLSLRQEDLLR